MKKPDIVGKRIELINCNDVFTKLRKGDRGVVTEVNPLSFSDTSFQISVNWDSGSTMMLLEGIDQYKVIEE